MSDSPVRPASGDELASFLRWLRRRLVYGALGALVGGAALFGASFLVPKSFVADSRFTVASERSSLSANRLAGFASQLGIAAALSAPESPDYFASVASSRDVYARMLADTVCLVAGGCARLDTLVLPSSESDVGRDRRERQLQALARRVTVNVNARTGVISATARMRTPELAEGLLRSQLRAVSRAISERRESQARNERRFAEERLAQLEQRRRAVVDSLTAFYEGNRQYESSPSLRFRERALQERLTLWQELVQGVARQAETSRLEEVRDTPVLNLVDSPYASPKKVGPKRSYWLLAGLLIGFLLALRPDQFLRHRA
jgi:uncharacterized protein involved in exopolysaccharide biosynthesis